METNTNNQLGEVINLRGIRHDPDPEDGMNEAAIKNRRDQIIADRTTVFLRQLVLNGNQVDTLPANVILFPSGRYRP